MMSNTENQPKVATNQNMYSSSPSTVLIIVSAGKIGELPYPYHSISLQQDMKSSISRFGVLVKAFREHNMPVFHARKPHSRLNRGISPSMSHQGMEPSDSMERENIGASSSKGRNSHHPIDEWAPKPWEVVIDMPSNGAVWNPSLHEQLLVWGITNLVIVGFISRTCAEITIGEIEGRGFGCCIIRDFIWENSGASYASPLQLHWPQELSGSLLDLEHLISGISTYNPNDGHVSEAGIADGWNGSLDLSSLRQAYRSGVSPVAVIMYVYVKLEKIRPETPYTFVSYISRTVAISAAEDLLRNFPDCTSLPPLFGVPFSLKDNIDYIGAPTTLACPPLAYQPTKSAAIYTKLTSLGAIYIGKTNMDQLATGLTGCRSPYGIQPCVYNPLYIAGGSSTGAAVSVGAELVSFAIGTDTAGSGRIPAGFNGVVGWKPTKGTVSLSGVFKACESLDSIAFMTTRRGGVRDAREIWKYVRGYDPEDTYSKSPSVSPPLRNCGGNGMWRGRFRFAMPPPMVVESCSQIFCELFYGAVTKLRAMGGEAVEIDWEIFEEAGKLLYDGALVNERLAAMSCSGKNWFQANTSKLHPVTSKVFSSVLRRENSAEDAFRDLKKMQILTRRAHDVIFNPSHPSSIDIIVVPTAPQHFTIQQVLKDPISLNSVLGTFTHFGNVLDLCGIAIPAGSYDLGETRMPFSITFLGGSGDDGRVLDLAKRFEDMIGAES